MSADGVLTAGERRLIEEAAGMYPTARAAAVDALKIVQEARGWVSDDALHAVSEVLGIPPADLDNLATFYNLIFRRPVGDHVILLCDSVSCWVMGYEAIRAKLGELYGIDFGQTSADGRFTLLPIPCLGACDGAPALMIDEDLHTNVDPDGLAELLDAYPAKGGGS